MWQRKHIAAIREIICNPTRYILDEKSQRLVPASSFRPDFNFVPKSSDINNVPQSTYGVTRFRSTARYLFTEALACCIGISLYDPVTHTGALAHLDINQPQASIKAMVRHLSAVGVVQSNLVARVVGGNDLADTFSGIYAYKILRTLQALQIPVQECDVLVNGHEESYSVVLDTKDGQLYENALSHQDILSFYMRAALGVPKDKMVLTDQQIIQYNQNKYGLAPAL